MGKALEPGRETFDQKMIVRKAIEEANIPFTYVSANCFAGYFAGNLSQMQTLLPPTHQLTLYGDGNVKGNPPTHYSSPNYFPHLCCFIKLYIKLPHFLR